MVNKNIPNTENFLNDWKLEPLSSTAKASSNGFIDGDWIESPYIQNSGIRLVQTGNIGIGRFVDNSESRKFISFRSFKELNCKWVYPGDILICRLADPIGRACIVPKEIGHCVTSVDCTIYRPDENKVNKSYVLHLLNSERFLKRASTIAAGSTRQRISRSNLGKIITFVPPLPEQRRIAEILDTIDEAIQKTEALISKLKAMKQGLLHDLLTRGLDKNGKLRDPKAHPEQFKDSPLGRIPKEWEIRELGEVAATVPNSFVDGPFGSNLKTNEYTDDGVRLIQLQNIGEGDWINDNKKFISELKFKELSRHAAYPGEIAIAKMADPVARACLLPTISERFVVVADCIKLLPDVKKYDSNYLVYEINHNIVRQQAEIKSTGTTRQRINLSVLKTVKVLIPFLSEQCRIVKVLNAHDARIRTEEQYRDKLKLQKKGLMHDLLTGKIRVKV
jgi:type I restriction enzyme S subunit